MEKISERLVRTLSGFGPLPDDLLTDPDAIKTKYCVAKYVDVTFDRLPYCLHFRLDYDCPGAVYLKTIFSPSTGDAWLCDSTYGYAYANRFPLDWAWV